jgi:GNAT superfamily N-acetyltransferase
MRVHSDFRGKGTARALIASAILFVPQGIRFLRSELGEMNARIFGEAEQRTRSFEEALKATPAYRGRRALGFGRIIPVLNDPFERVRLCTEFDGCE